MPNPLARFASSALGYDFPDPNPEVRRQWAVFEAMIALMTPQGFANLMSTMWPELIAAMPFGMGPMMRMMGKIPGALALMKPMFPILFPRLLPMMMPKVLPTMLERVGAAVFRTDEDGLVTLHTDGSSLDVQGFTGRHMEVLPGGAKRQASRAE